MLRILIPVGSPVEASSLQEIFKSFISPGVVNGFELFVYNNNTLGLAAGAAITDSGVFIFEDEVRTLTIEQTVSSKDYTVVYKYTASNDFGGGTASLQLIQGLLSEDTFANGVIIGWVKYTGGSTPLSGDMMIPATKIKLGKPESTAKDNYTNVLAPLSTKWLKKAFSGPSGAVVVNDLYDATLFALVTQVANTGASLASAEFIVPFVVPVNGVGQLLIDFSVSSAAAMTVDILTETGAVVIPETNIPVFTNRAMSKEIFSIPKHADLTSGKMFYVRCNMSLQPTHEVKLKRLGISSYMEPV